jgi:BirA family biotin operon repressor/biotin-[acetyl-CoA-carboxylase] ligase
LSRKEGGNHGTFILTDYQTAGRGQKGKAWISEPQSNLLFSLILKTDFLNASQAYLLNVMTSLALRDVVSRMLGNKLVEVKWPNDLYTSGNKISGILVETLLRGRLVEYAVIGVGINVNQEHFSLSNATSMSLLNKKKLDRELVMDNILKSIEHYFLMLRGGKYDFLLTRYAENLMWIDERHTFQLDTGKIFQGVIRGIDGQGRLIIHDDESAKQYDIKQVSFLA